MKYEHMFGIDIIVFAELTSRVRCSTRTVVKYAVKSYNIMKIYKNRCGRKEKLLSQQVYMITINNTSK